jgi:hypothetical protein
LLADRIGWRLVEPKDLAAGGMEGAVGDQFVDGAAGLESGVELQERLGPERAVVERVFDPAFDPLVGDFDEAAGVVGVVVDEPLTEIKDVHSELRVLGSTERQANPFGRRQCTKPGGVRWHGASGRIREQETARVGERVSGRTRDTRRAWP